MKARHYIACDLGAESGRVMLGTLDAGKLTLEEMQHAEADYEEYMAETDW